MADQLTTIACVYVHGHVKDFRPEYVIKLASMVSRHMDGRPYTFVCLTDRPEKIYARNVELVKIPPPAPLPRPMPYGYPAGKAIFAWWSKLELWNPRHGLTGRVLYLDLDTLVVDSLLPILDYPSPFALVPHAGTFNGRLGLRVVKRFNSSVMVWDAGVNHRLFTEWTPEIAMDLHGDQDWIGQQMPEADTMPAAWFPRISDLKMERPGPEAKVILAKHPKNALAAEWYPWVREVWV